MPDQDPELKPELTRIIRTYGYDDDLPSYLPLMRPILEGRDVFAQGPFPLSYYYLSICILQRIRTASIPEEEYTSCQAIVVTPTPELAWNMKNVANQVATFMPSIEAYACRVSQDFIREEEAGLQAGGRPPQIVTGSPWRISRHIPTGVLKTDEVSIIAIDGVDDILSRGLEDSLVDLLRRLPCETAQVVVHSRSLKQWREVWRVVGGFMKNAVRVWDDAERI
ncbi:Eif4a2p [Aspergillus nanangensis]|uniref:ATP-dependent RNA helicase n=1 Tax=Aspergillus nanangensis TaxID=2582783 RepID=A0AAD4CRL3_ASPNN|nr:Eif4a2p [Aspergillus nanangensis]